MQKTHVLKPGDGCRGEAQSGDRYRGDRVPRSAFAHGCPALALIGGVADGSPGGAGGVGDRGIGGKADITETADDVAHHRVFAAEQMGAAGDVEPDRARAAKSGAAAIFVRRRPRAEPAAPVADLG